MPRIKLTKTAIDALPTPLSDLVYWDTGLPGFGVKVTPKGRKVFLALYRNGGAGSKLRKYTVGPYGRVTLHQARVAAQKVFAARLEGRDPAAERREAKRKLVADRIEDLLEIYITHRLAQNRSAGEISRLLRREFGKPWAGRSIHDVKKRDVVEVVTAIEQRGAPAAAKKALKAIKSFFCWCVGRAIIERSPAEGVAPLGKEVTRDRVLDDGELARVILAARQIGGPYGWIVELLGLTGQRREEVAQLTWEELDVRAQMWTIPKARTKNSKTHIVHLSGEALGVLNRALEQSNSNKRTVAANSSERQEGLVFSTTSGKAFNAFSQFKRLLDRQSGVTEWRLHDLRRTCVSGMARLGVAPHVADKILNHQSGTISGVAAVYQRHEFLAERKEALEIWAAHVTRILAKMSNAQSEVRRAA